MNPAYEIALKEIGSKAWKGESRISFVETMLQGASISTPDRSATAYLEWGHPIDLELARPGDVVVVSTGTAKAATDAPVFFIRRTGAFIEALTLALDDQDVRPHRFSTKRIKGISRPPKRVEQVEHFQFYNGRQALEVEQVKDDLASFLAPGAGSKDVQMRKLDPLPPPVPTPDVEAVDPRKPGKLWLVSVCVTLGCLLAAIVLGVLR